jgi:hypothetical protein
MRNYFLMRQFPTSNHMTCYKCRFHFCWQCMGKFGQGADGDSSGYSNHKCNNFVEEDSKVKTDKEDWERYRWYVLIRKYYEIILNFFNFSRIFCTFFCRRFFYIWIMMTMITAEFPYMDMVINGFYY